jgi:hypothetical protein
MRWRDIRFEKPTEHDQEGYSGEVLVAYKDNTKQAVHWMDIGKTDATHWAPLSELPDPPDRIPDPPEGWRFVQSGEPFDNRAKFWGTVKDWVITGNAGHYSPNTCYIVPIDPPKPPEPQYRPFANAAEFEPYELKFWRYKDDCKDLRRKPCSYSNDGHFGDGWSRSFDSKVFSDGSPFGVKVET